jgi:hypothetical protein
MPQDEITGADGRESGIRANTAMAKRFPLLSRDEMESTVQKTVFKDRAGRRYWFKNGRNTPTMGQKALQKYYALLLEDKDGRIFLVRCDVVIAHPRLRRSKSSGHGPTNPHLQLAMRYIREVGQEVNPTIFDGA